MLVEIQNIETDALGAVLAGLDFMGLQELTNVFARWTFELEWPEIAEIAPEKLELVRRVFDTACRSYSMRIGELELRKLVIDEEEKDEPAPDLEMAPVLCRVRLIETDRIKELVSMIRGLGMQEFADIIETGEVRDGYIPRPTGDQLAALRDIFALYKHYHVVIDDVTYQA